MSIGRAKEGVRTFEGFSEKEKTAIDQGNAKALFPRLAKAIEELSLSVAGR